MVIFIDLRTDDTILITPDPGRSVTVGEYRNMSGCKQLGCCTAYIARHCVRVSDAIAVPVINISHRCSRNAIGKSGHLISRKAGNKLLQRDPSCQYICQFRRLLLDALRQIRNDLNLFQIRGRLISCFTVIVLDNTRCRFGLDG